MATSLAGRLDEIAGVESGLGVELPTAYRDLYRWTAGPSMSGDRPRC